MSASARGGGLAPGTVFAGHRIEEIAGRGGMGVVYRARHIALDHVVALKVISPELVGDERFRARFQSESRIAVSIRHPNVVSVHHAGEEDGLLFVTMDYIEGTDLRGLLNREGWLEAGRASALLDPVAAALDAAHARGLIHRDIKPGNVLIGAQDGGEHVYLTDFGLARAIDAETGLTASGAFIGTLDYAAPEQIKGERLDARTDVYALGCLLHEMLCGSTLFAKQTEKVAKMYAHISEPPPDVRELRPELPPELALAVQRAVAKDPDDRFPSAGDLARAASAAVEGRSVSEDERTVAIGEAAPAPTTEMATAGPPTAPHPPPTAPLEAPATVATTHRSAPRHRRLVAGIAVLGVIAAIVAVVLISGGGGDGAPEQAASGGENQSQSQGPGNAEVMPGSIPVDGFPVGVAVGFDHLWVGSREGGTLTEIDPQTKDPVDTIEALPAPEGVTVGPASIYVALSEENAVLRINGDTGEQSRIPVGITPRAVAHAEGIYVTNAGSNTVTPVDTSKTTATPLDPIPVGTEPHGIAIGEGSVWVTNRGDGTVTQIDENSDEVTGTIEVGANPKGIAFAEGTVWVANTDDATVTPIDAGSGKAGEPIDVPAEPRGVTAAFDSVWVANGGGFVTRIDPATQKTQELKVGTSPEEVAGGEKFLYVTDGAADAVYRIRP